MQFTVFVSSGIVFELRRNRCAETKMKKNERERKRERENEQAKNAQTVNNRNTNTQMQSKMIQNLLSEHKLWHVDC